MPKSTTKRLHRAKDVADMGLLPHLLSSIMDGLTEMLPGAGVSIVITTPDGSLGTFTTSAPVDKAVSGLKAAIEMMQSTDIQGAVQELKAAFRASEALDEKANHPTPETMQ